MKTIGIIGGMSYESSIHYYERINNQVNELAGGLTCARMIIYNVNFEEIRLLMLNNEWDKIGEELTKIAKILEKSGADYIAIATNTMHKLADIIQSKINIPLIHIADCVSDKYTMVEDFLKNRLKKNGLTIHTPDSEDTINEIDRIIFDELCKGKIKKKSRDYYISVIKDMIKKYDIKGVIFGCTEIEMLVKQENLDIPIFDTTQAHIDSIVDYSLEKIHK